MEQMKKGKLRRVFIVYVAVTFLIVAVLSALVIWGCYAVRAWLLPESGYVYLNMEYTYVDGTKTTTATRVKIGEEAKKFSELISEPELEKTGEVKYGITSIDSDYTMLSPKRRLLYQTCGVLMIVLPLLFSVAGILLCGLRFYALRLEKPIAILSEATEKIAEQDLDFVLASPSDDELGALCVSFEQMKNALAENNRRMWAMLEERRRLQASVAHDLRNPIAIIESHAEYLRLNLPEGKLSDEKILSLAGNIEKAAKRLENYTESIRAINHLEELEIEKKPTPFGELCADMEEDFRQILALCGLTLCMENQVADESLTLDAQLLYRILENLVGNAARYAKSEICIVFSREGNRLNVRVEDDGCGFPGSMQNAPEVWLQPEGDGEGHSGLGLVISRILCKKHGGQLTIGNLEPEGASVKFFLEL